MTHEAGNIVVAVDAELQALEQRVSRLREIRRLALELEHTRVAGSPTQPASAPARRPRARRHTAPLSAEAVIDVARDMLADGPTTIGKILDQLGRARTQRATAAVKEALEQLGATVVGRARGGGDLYALHAEPDEGAGGGVDRGELLVRVRELARNAVGWSDEEFRYQLRKRCRIDASRSRGSSGEARAQRSHGVTVPGRSAVALADAWHERARRLERYAQACRREGLVRGPEGAEDAEQAALDYVKAAAELEHGADRQHHSGEEAEDRG